MWHRRGGVGAHGACAAGIAALLGLGAPGLAGGGARSVQPEGSPGVTGEAPRRVLQVFDFDATDNPDPIPPQWQRTMLTADGKPREGFPIFNKALLDRTVSRSGAWSVKLPTAGGSTALRLKAGETAVFADADYAVAAQVRTEGLASARAFLTARLLDQRLSPIAGSEVRSEPVVSAGAWTPVSVRVPGKHDGAAWLQIDLELLQERQYSPAARDEPAARAISQHKVWREDVDGAAWFDDVSVLQIPQATLSTTSPRNVVIGDEPPTLVMTVRDLGGDALKARVRVHDINGRLVAEHLTGIDPGGRALSWTPELPGFGWYSARMDVLIQPRAGEPAAAQTEVSRGETRFIRVPRSEGLSAKRTATAPATRTDDNARFGIIAEATPDDRFADLPALLERLGAGFVHLPVWQSDSTTETVQASLAARRGAIEQLLGNGRVITFSITGIPTAVASAARVPFDDALALAGVPDKDWVPYLVPTLDIFGQRVTRFQIGRISDDHAFWKKDLRGSVRSIDRTLSGMVPAPMLSIPWQADRQWAGLFADARARRSSEELLDAITVRYPAAFSAGALAETVAEIAGTPAGATGPGAAGARELTVAFEPLAAGRYDREAGVIELARRAIEFWRIFGDHAEGPAARVAIEQPWEWADDGSGRVWPTAEAAAFVTLRQRLAGRRIVGEVRATPGVRCYVLAARDGSLGTLDRGALVAWNESADPERAFVETAAAGAGLVVVDVFGNQRAIAAGGSDGEDGDQPSALVSVPVGESPVFIEGIDPYLSLFAASFRLEPAFMPAIVREHEHRITLSNPWPVRVTGKLQLKEDSDRRGRGRSVMDEWRVSPSGIMDFDMAPGQTLSLPVTLSFGPGQLAGIKDFVIVARPIADRAYPPVRLKASIEVGLRDIDMQPEVQATDSGDVLVIASITNRGTHARTLRLETAARRMPSQQLQISDLSPGQTVLRRFVFKDAAKALSGRRIVISLSDLEEAQRLNKAVVVP